MSSCDSNRTTGVGVSVLELILSGLVERRRNNASVTVDTDTFGELPMRSPCIRLTPDS